MGAARSNSTSIANVPHLTGENLEIPEFPLTSRLVLGNRLNTMFQINLILPHIHTSEPKKLSQESEKYKEAELGRNKPWTQSWGL